MTHVTENAEFGVRKIALNKRLSKMYYLFILDIIFMRNVQLFRNTYDGGRAPSAVKCLCGVLHEPESCP